MLIAIRYSVLLVLINCFLLWKYVSMAKIELKCPEYCQCDVFKGLKRAVCQNKQLVSIELDIPSQAQLLDISYNQISVLGDKIFLEIGLTDLKLLNLSHNKVGQIHLNGFEGLENLKTLDLSFNAVEYFKEAWFVSLKSLQELYLRGNKLKSINSEPLIESQSLKVLDISKCGIINLKPEIFSKIPNLEVLDISENYLQRITLEIIKPLNKLAKLIILDNNFHCKDRALSQLKNYTRSKGIFYADPCLNNNVMTSFNINNKPVKMFEKIVMADDDEAATKTSVEKNSWIVDDSELNNTKIIEVCSGKGEVNNSKVEDKKGFLMEIIQVSPRLTVIIIFVYGVLFGMVLLSALNFFIRKKELRNTQNIPDGSTNFNSTMQSISSRISRRTRNNRPKRSNSVLYSALQRARRQLSGESQTYNELDDALVMSEFDLGNSTPLTPRRNPSPIV